MRIVQLCVIWFMYYKAFCFINAEGVQISFSDSFPQAGQDFFYNLAAVVIVIIALKGIANLKNRESAS